MLLINSCFLFLQSGLFHIGNTVGADAFVVELLFLYEVAIDANLVLQLWCVFIHHVDDSSAFLAEKSVRDFSDFHRSTRGARRW